MSAKLTYFVFLSLHSAKTFSVNVANTIEAQILFTAWQGKHESLLKTDGAFVGFTDGGMHTFPINACLNILVLSPNYYIGIFTTGYPSTSCRQNGHILSSNPSILQKLFPYMLQTQSSHRYCWQHGNKA